MARSILRRLRRGREAEPIEAERSVHSHTVWAVSHSRSRDVEPVVAGGAAPVDALRGLAGGEGRNCQKVSPRPARAAAVAAVR